MTDTGLAINLSIVFAINLYIFSFVDLFEQVNHPKKFKREVTYDSYDDIHNFEENIESNDHDVVKRGIEEKIEITLGLRGLKVGYQSDKHNIERRSAEFIDEKLNNENISSNVTRNVATSANIFIAIGVVLSGLLLIILVHNLKTKLNVSINSTF